MEFIRISQNDFETSTQSACRQLLDLDLLRFLQCELGQNGCHATLSSLGQSGPSGTCIHISARYNKIETLKVDDENIRESNFGA